ncbi:hypothetical protein GCM10010505_37040 [Kitasatospora aburaviensis]
MVGQRLRDLALVLGAPRAPGREELGCVGYGDLIAMEEIITDRPEPTATP